MDSINFHSALKTCEPSEETPYVLVNINRKLHILSKDKDDAQYSGLE